MVTALAVKVPDDVRVCPDGTDIPAFAVINPEAVIVLVEIAVPEANAFAVSAVPAVVGFQLLLIFILDDISSNSVLRKEPIRFPDVGVNVDNKFPPILNELPVDILTSPLTSNLYVECDVVPIPIFPLGNIVITLVSIEEVDDLI